MILHFCRWAVSFSRIPSFKKIQINRHIIKSYWTRQEQIFIAVHALFSTSQLYLGCVMLMHFIMLGRRFPGIIDDAIINKLFQNTIARDGPFQFLLVHFHCPNPRLAGNTARPVVVFAFPNESVAAPWGSQANSACRYTSNNDMKRL